MTALCLPCLVPFKRSRNYDVNRSPVPASHRANTVLVSSQHLHRHVSLLVVLWSESSRRQMRRLRRVQLERRVVARLRVDLLRSLRLLEPSHALTRPRRSVSQWKCHPLGLRWWATKHLKSGHFRTTKSSLRLAYDQVAATTVWWWHARTTLRVTDRHVTRCHRNKCFCSRTRTARRVSAKIRWWVTARLILMSRIRRV